MVSRVVMGSSKGSYGLKVFDERGNLIVDTSTITTVPLKAETIDVNVIVKKNRKDGVLSNKTNPSGFSIWSKRISCIEPIDDFDGLGVF